jgi:hypothetical protein
LLWTSTPGRIPAFCLTGQLMRSAPEGFAWAQEWKELLVLRRITFAGFIDPAFEDKLFPSRMIATAAQTLWNPRPRYRRMERAKSTDPDEN